MMLRDYVFAREYYTDQATYENDSIVHLQLKVSYMVRYWTMALEGFNHCNEVQGSYNGRN